MRSSESFPHKLWRYDGSPGARIPRLPSAQEHFGYIPRRAIGTIGGDDQHPGIDHPRRDHLLHPVPAAADGPPPDPGLREDRRPRLRASVLVEATQDELGVEMGGTTEDGLLTLSTVACQGCCSPAPAMMIDGSTHGRLAPASARKLSHDIRREAQRQARVEARS